jgi:O-antigen/teichoic acid export membrane protein
MGAIASTIVTSLQLIVVLILMLSGFGLISLMIVNLCVSLLSIVITLLIVKKILPELKLSLLSFSRNSFKKMGVFGIQMQISRLSSFAAEKYNEFLLGIFTNLSNVTFYNVGNKISSYGRIISLQITAGIPPVSADLSAKEEKEKLSRLYIDCTKYLNVISVPIFIYMIFFAEKLIYAWIGPGYETSVLILRVLALGYLLNFILSAPGNSIIPSTGRPKYQMYEGLIGLLINLVVSYFLIMEYGIFGAAFGNLIATIGASVYLFYKSNRFFRTSSGGILAETIMKPVLISVLCSLVCLGIYFAFTYFNIETGRINSIISAAINIAVFSLLYLYLLLKSRFFNKRDIEFFTKFFTKVPVVNTFIKRRQGNEN